MATVPAAIRLSNGNVITLRGGSPRFFTPSGGGGGGDTRSLGLNLMKANDGEEPRWIDRGHQVRVWTRTSAGNNYSPISSAYLDSNGNLTSLPPGDTSARLVICDPLVTGTGYRGGTFRFWWDGEATYTTNGVTNINVLSSNSFEGDMTWDGLHEIVFTPTNPANMPRNFHLVRTDLLDAYNAGDIIDPGQITLFEAAGVKCFRFMDWMQTNNSTVEDWADYPTLTNQHWETVPFGAMVELCNLLDADGWFCVPERATDAFVTSMATYLRDNMNSNLKVRIEYSNEIWNGGFSAYSYIEGLANAAWGTTVGVYDYTAIASMAGKRMYEVATICRSVFSSQPDRLIMVAGGIAAYDNFYNVDLLTAPTWQSNAPGDWVSPHTVFDELAIATYFGANAMSGNSAAIESAVNTSAAAGRTAIEATVDAAVNAFPVGTINRITVCAGIATTYGLNLVAYEGNNHYHAQQMNETSLVSGITPTTNYRDALYGATYGQVFADAYDDIRDHWKAEGGQLMCHFTDIDPWRIFGGFGLKEHRDQTTIPWTAMVNWHNANPKWW